jgi:deazaflavin-dependent oxidoreductase (nitroreductase family)
MTASGDLQTKLDRVADYERSVRPGPVTGLFRRLGRTKGFARVYRVVGPKIDPHVAKIADGAVLAKVYGFPILMLSTTGAKSGQARLSPLVYVRDGQDFVVVGTSFGQPRHPGWTANLRANSEASVSVGPETVAVTAEQVDQPTWHRLFPRFVAIYPGYADYLTRRQGLAPRMFLLHPHP